MADYSWGPYSKIAPAGFAGLLLVVLVVVGTASLFPFHEVLIAGSIILGVSAGLAVVLYRFRSRSSG
ncbi:MAG: hypothetical protein LAO05_06500 [Acidobacteriia bacterium]|nr:hypothetical protein [Terriglobia bacterium]